MEIDLYYNLFSFAMNNHSQRTGQFVALDGYVYKIMAIRHIKDPLILKNRLNSENSSEDYFILKRHSHLNGAWARPCLATGRAISCEILSPEEMSCVNELNSDLYRSIKFERYDDPYFSFKHQVRYLCNSIEHRDDCVDRLNNVKSKLPRYFSTLNLKDSMLSGIGIDLYKPLEYSVPNNPLQIRLILYSNYMHTDNRGNILLSDIEASSIKE